MALTKKLIIIAFSVMLFVVAFFGSITVCSYCMQKKAVIILPGLFASGLYDEATGDMVWDPFYDSDVSLKTLVNENGLNFEEVMSLLQKDSLNEQLNKLMDDDCYGADDSFFNMMAMNEDGTSVVKTIKPVSWNSESRLRYGVINAQKEMYEELNAVYGKEYEVQVFNYDFRLDGRYTAELLENYINSKGYTEVILVSHSNGGEIAALYLARSAENRNKVSKYISYNSPYLGSFSAITTLENPNAMILDVLRILDSNSLLSSYSRIVQNVFNYQFLKLLNIWTVYQLLPNSELLNLDYGGAQCKIVVDSVEQSFDSDEELWEFYCSRPWAKTSTGELRIQMNEWLDFRNAMYVTLDDGSRVLSIKLVDTTYFTGDNVNTTYAVYYTTTDDGVAMTSTGYTRRGDGTVLYSSAVAGTSDQNKLYVMDGIDHNGVVSDYYGNAERATVQAINEYFKVHRKWYDVWDFD